MVPKLGGPAMNGIYATMTAQIPYADDASQPLRFWFNKYQTKYNEEPTVFSVYGYAVMDIFIQAASKTGANLTTDNFIKVMESTTVPRDIFGSDEGTFTPAKHYGSTRSRVSQIVDGRWKVIADYVDAR
jgi:branched-chain amino acid transport system substrate-binding protein